MTTENTPAATGAAKYPRLTRWVVPITTGVAALVLLIQALSFFTLPSCDDSNIRDTLRSIYKERNIDLGRVSDMKWVSEEKGRKTCTARIEGAGETADITYAVFWDGWSKRVQITEVRAATAAPSQ